MKHDFSFESPAPHINVENENKFLILRNKIQRDLMIDYVKEKERSAPADSLGEAERVELKRKWMEEWADLFSEKFGEIFHRMIVANPHLLEDLERLPDAEFDLIKEELYRDENIVDPQEFEEAFQS